MSVQHAFNGGTSTKYHQSENSPVRTFRMVWREKHRVFNIDGTVFEIEQFPVGKNEDEESADFMPQAERTGMVVWNSAVVLSFAAREWIMTRFYRSDFTRVLELGAGLGLPGLVAAAALNKCARASDRCAGGSVGSCKGVGVSSGGEVILTDLPLVMDAIKTNVSRIKAALNLSENTLRVAALSWGDREQLRTIIQAGSGADLVLCADCVYFVNSHASLLETFVELTRLNPSVEILMCQKKRNERIERDFFNKKVPACGLQWEALELPPGILGDKASLNVLGYEDPLAFVGITLISIRSAQHKKALE